MSEKKSRVDEAVPRPDETGHLTEEQKQALEASAEIEHAQGPQKEELAKKAQQTGR